MRIDLTKAVSSATETLHRNIAATIRDCKRKGTCGMSLANLKMITPTTGLMCSPAMYHAVFADVAREVGAKLRFPIYSDEAEYQQIFG